MNRHAADRRTAKRRTALVTGAGRGIGRGIAAALAAKGFTVAINYRTDERAAQECLNAVLAAGGEGFTLKADVSDLAEHEALVSAVLAKAGEIDLLVNNAGMAPKVREDILSLSPESYDEVMTTNLRGPFFLTQRVARVMADFMLTTEGGRDVKPPMIINITSISAAVASVNRAEYCLSKAGLSMTTKLWAVRLAEFGVRVYEIRPGIIETDMTAGVKEKYDKLLAEGIALIPRWGKPEDVGAAVAALADGAFSYATGEVFTLDGGVSLLRL